MGNIHILLSKFLIESFGNIFQLAVHFSCRRAHNETTQRILGPADVAEAAHQMDGAVSQDYSCLCCILYGVLGLALLA